MWGIDRKPHCEPSKPISSGMSQLQIGKMLWCESGSSMRVVVWEWQQREGCGVRVAAASELGSGTNFWQAKWEWAQSERASTSRHAVFALVAAHKRLSGCELVPVVRLSQRSAHELLPAQVLSGNKSGAERGAAVVAECSSIRHAVSTDECVPRECRESAERVPRERANSSA